MGMTNREKFMEVFKGEPDTTVCPIYCTTVKTVKGDCPYCTTSKYCEAGDWWKKEYKEINDGNNN